MKSKYQIYKDNFKWIKSIPNNWEISKFRFIFKIFTGDSLNESQKDKYETYNYNHQPYISSKDINLQENKINYKTGLRIPIDSKEFKISPKGSFLLVIEGGSAGRKVAFVEQDVFFVNKLCSFNSKIVNKYFYYFVQSKAFQEQFNIYLNGLIGGVSQNSIKNIFVPNPPQNQKCTIVSQLDKETKEIITSIKKIENMINLLKEKRFALISEITLTGLNKNAILKKSNIAWVGDVPQNWEVKRLRFLGKLSNGLSKSSDYFGKGYPFFSYGDIYNNESLPTNPEGLVESDESERKKCSVKRGDIFFTRTSETTDDIGVSSVCLETVPDATFSGFVIRFRLFKETLLPEYAKYIFQNHFKKSFIESRMNIVTRSSLSQVTLSDMPIIFTPNKVEQKEIYQYLDKETKIIDHLINKNKKLVSLLKEYKYSLISEKVLGN